MMEAIPAPDASSLVMGFLATVALHGAFGLVALFSKNGTLLTGYIFGLPVVQLIWVLPLFVFKYSKKHRRFCMGILLCAALTALLYGACWGYAALRLH